MRTTATCRHTFVADEAGCRAVKFERTRIHSDCCSSSTKPAHAILSRYAQNIELIEPEPVPDFLHDSFRIPFKIFRKMLFGFHRKTEHVRLFLSCPRSVFFRWQTSSKRKTRSTCCVIVVYVCASATCLSYLLSFFCRIPRLRHVLIPLSTSECLLLASSIDRPITEIWDFQPYVSLKKLGVCCRPTNIMYFLYLSTQNIYTKFLSACQLVSISFIQVSFPHRLVIVFISRGSSSPCVVWFLPLPSTIYFPVSSKNCFLSLLLKSLFSSWLYGSYHFLGLSLINTARPLSNGPWE